MPLRAVADLIVILKTIDMTNVSALSDRPYIRTNSTNDSGGSYASGELVINDEIYIPTPLTRVYRHERYTIPAKFTFDDTVETTFKEILEEWRRILDVATDQPDRAYMYDLQYTWNTKLRRLIGNCIFVVIKPYVKKVV